MEPEMGDELIKQLKFAVKGVGFLARFTAAVFRMNRRSESLYDRMLREQQKASAVDPNGQRTSTSSVSATVVRSSRQNKP